MAITDAIRTRESTNAAHGDGGAQSDGADGGTHGDGADSGTHGDGGASGFRPVPVWFFAFEGLLGASYDIVKSSPYAWTFIAACVVANIALARTVLRGRLKMAKAILKGRRTRKIAVGLIALRAGVHIALGAAGMQFTSPPAHIAVAVAMCAATVALLAFDQRVMLRALAAG
ncbi:hypothetical protein [Streptomyces sp. NBC_01477]|uniref:hypothetical protein n=1 Tax=Streptomyces sp. NBC_01477 TaxID=2976015 RepID=UPI002E338737|nr:hypothetical protein [Streptomyces sp. NBC_01477]